jgi:hypothetical protein
VRARAVLWWSMLGLVVFTGVVVGYGSLFFQFFGDRADREDHLVSAGGYLTAGAVCALAALSAVRQVRPARLGVAGCAAVVLTLLGLSSWRGAAALPVDPSPFANGVVDGVGGVLLTPWTWVLVGLSAYDLLRPRRVSEA